MVLGHAHASAPAPQCVAPCVRVRMAVGGLKAVGDVAVGDRVRVACLGSAEQALDAAVVHVRHDAAAADDKDGGKKVLPVVLAGINRALPFASASGGGSRSTAAVEALMESLFETVEASLGSFSAATQALLVLQQLLPGASSSTCSRFYSAL